MSLPALTQILGGSEAKVLSLCSPHWPASPSPAGRNILSSVKNNKHGLININRPTQCQKGKREDCALLAGASLDRGATASSIIWRQPAGSPGPGHVEVRPGPAESATRSSDTGRPQMAPVPCARASLWTRVMSLPYLKPSVAPHWPRDRAHMPQSGTEGPSHSSLNLPRQAHGSQPWRVFCHFPEMPNSHSSEIFHGRLPLGEGRLLL